MGVIPGPGTVPVESGNLGHVQWSFCSVNRPWRSRSRRRRGDRYGLDRETRDGHRCGEEPPIMYTGCCVQSWRSWRSRCRDRREASGSSTSRIERPRSWGKPRVETSGARNDSGPSPCLLVGLGRSQQDPRMRQKIQETAENQGPSWRKQPRQESLRPRNSSGSLILQR
jgi:hypothetical protein